jgi:PST family polysaccharide transporter
MPLPVDRCDASAKQPSAAGAVNRGLRARILRGAGYMAMRQAAGVVLGFGGVLLLTRAIGPADYGLYAAAVGLFAYVQGLCHWGIQLQLVRRAAEPSRVEYDLAATALLVLALAGAGLALLLLPLLAAWMRLAADSAVVATVLISLPLGQVAQVPLARLERDLDYRTVASIELLGQMSYYVVGLPLAFGGFGPWSPVIGWWAQQLIVLVLACRGARYVPRWYWNGGQARMLLSSGLRISAAYWLWNLRYLVNPLIVGRYAGPEAVGFVALASRLAEGLSFVKAATWRIGVAALARFQHDRSRVARAVAHGMGLQVLAVGPMLALFGAVGAWVVPLMIGDRWAPVFLVFPFVALGALVNAAFTLHTAALVTLGKNRELALFHLAHAMLLAIAALVFVPRIGFLGYGVAEIVALAGYGVAHAAVVRVAGPLDYRIALTWLVAIGSTLFAPRYGALCLLGLVVIALSPASYTALATYARELRQAS